MTIKDIYKYALINEPEIIEYSDIEQCMTDWSNWQKKANIYAGPLWWYQLPMLHPASCIAQYDLIKFNYQFKLQRKLNRQGVLIVNNIRDSVNLNPQQMKDIYNQATIGYSKDSVDERAISIFNYIETKHPAVADFLWSVHDRQFPTSQCSASEFAIIAPSSIYREEYEIFKKMCELSRCDCDDEGYSTLFRFSGEGMAYLTFQNIALKFPISKIFD